MANPTPKMALRMWDQENDPWHHDVLTDNFNTFDIHDHTLGRGEQIGSAGITDGAITLSKLSTTALDLNYRTALRASGVVLALEPGPVYMDESSAAPAAIFGMYRIYYFDPADWAVAAGNSGKLKFIATCVTNSVAPAATFTYGLYSVVGVFNGTPTLGSVVGSTVSIVTPAANSQAVASTTALTVPAAGNYVFRCTMSATTAAPTAHTMRMLIRK